MVAKTGNTRTNTIAAIAIVRISMVVEYNYYKKVGLKPNNALD
jgi:hypothetical protein